MAAYCYCEWLKHGHMFKLPYFVGGSSFPSADYVFLQTLEHPTTRDTLGAEHHKSPFLLGFLLVVQDTTFRSETGLESERGASSMKIIILERRDAPKFARRHLF